MYIIAFWFGSIALEYFLDLTMCTVFYLCPMENRDDKKTELELKTKRKRNESRIKKYKQSFLEPVWWIDFSIDIEHCETLRWNSESIQILLECRIMVLYFKFFAYDNGVIPFIAEKNEQQIKKIKDCLNSAVCLPAYCQQNNTQTWNGVRAYSTTISFRGVFCCCCI